MCMLRIGLIRSGSQRYVCLTPEITILSDVIYTPLKRVISPPTLTPTIHSLGLVHISPRPHIYTPFNITLLAFQLNTTRLYVFPLPTEYMELHLVIHRIPNPYNTPRVRSPPTIHPRPSQGIHQRDCIDGIQVGLDI